VSKKTQRIGGNVKGEDWLGILAGHTIRFAWLMLLPEQLQLQVCIRKLCPESASSTVTPIVPIAGVAVKKD
jgi:hypothetical protein